MGRRPRPSAHSPSPSGLARRNPLGPAPPREAHLPDCAPQWARERTRSHEPRRPVLRGAEHAEMRVACAGPFGPMRVTVEPLDADAASPGLMATSTWAVGCSRAQGGPGLGQHPWGPADGPGTQSGQRVQPPGPLSRGPLGGKQAQPFTAAPGLPPHHCVRMELWLSACLLKGPGPRGSLLGWKEPVASGAGLWP